VPHVSLIYCFTRVLVSQASVLFRSCCMLQDLAVGLLHFSGRARMCHRRMRMQLAHRTRTPCRIATRISRACTARSSPCDGQCSVAPSRQGTDRSRASLLMLGAEVTRTWPPEDFCSILPSLSFTRRGVSPRDGPPWRLCRGTIAVPIGRIPQPSFNQS